MMLGLIVFAAASKRREARRVLSWQGYSALTASLCVVRGIEVE
jgi:hypothetical protein